MANETTSVIEVQLDVTEAMVSATELDSVMNSIKEALERISKSISKTFTPMINSLKKIEAGINNVSTACVQMVDSLGAVNNSATAIKDTDGVFDGVAEGYKSVIKFFDKVGEAEKYSGKFQNLFEELATAPNMGNMLVSMFPKTADLFSTISQWINENVITAVTQTLSAGSGIIGAGATKIVTSITDVFKDIGNVFSGMSLGWGAAIAGIVALIVLLVNNWDTVKAAILTAWEAIKQALETAAEWINTTVIQPIASLLAPIVEWFSQLFESIWQTVTSVVNNIVTAIVEYIEKGKEILGTIGAWVYENVIQPIVEFFSPLVEWFGQLFQNIWQTITDIFSNIIAFIVGYVEVVMAIWGAVGTWFYEHVIQPVAAFFVDLWNGVSTWAINAWQGIKEVFAGIAAWFSQYVIQPVANFFAGMWDGFSNAATQAWEAVKSIFSKVTGFFKDIFTKAWDSVVGVFSVAGEIFTNIKDGILTAFKKIVNGIITGINAVVKIPFDGINSAISAIRSISIFDITPFSGLKNINVPQIPYLAKGAVLPANKPFLAVVGDQKHGTNVEAPLATIQEAVAAVLGDKLSGMMAGFDAVVAEQRATRRVIEAIEIGDETIAMAAQRYNRKMAVVRGAAW